jgi:pantoate kinase
LVHKLERVATAFSPAHITGLLQICDQPKDPLFKGSRGAGFSLTKGVKTTVRLQKSVKKSIEVKINGEIAASAEVSKSVAKTFSSLAKADYRIFVEHEVEVPIGCGFGSSGAGGLSLALAFNEALDLKLSRVEAAQIAHVAEVKFKTGLGTVIAEMYGGVEIREKPGAPGVGEIKAIRVNDNYAVACLSFGSISTKNVLTNSKLRNVINKFGGKLVDELIRQPTLHNFLEFSRSFAESTTLMSKRVRNVLNQADAHGINCSMAMFGETVFSIVKRDELGELSGIFRKHDQSELGIIAAEIDSKGARILK